ncbi:MAG: tRNA preQ1(34) S-adenosylmethionine ribosyltransferase-isomerase QueA [Betaproteobacteria bacterium]|nr:MAG: tRNA preQ1(34) S-adenosylmethionine ribosyltransferase-isomerase QueA [Betaproteobacteria bacterium]
MKLTLSDFDYALPPDLIAQAPADERTSSRLLHVAGDAFADLHFRDLPELIAPGDLLVLNDTRVIRARLIGRKPTGGRVEALIERIVDRNEAWLQIKASHMPKIGSSIDFAGRATATVVARDERLFRLRFDIDEPLLEWLERHGEVPLPPYITRQIGDDDARRYQTVYARYAGAVAAPTAGLHFDTSMLAALARRGVGTAFVTRHVGAGTFSPVESKDLSQHRMHAERFDVPATTAQAIAITRARGGRILAVGTTTLRALESAADAGGVQPLTGETRLFITPGFRFRVVDRLLTNFHLPKSTLLMLVSAFAGMETVRRAYRHAVAKRYRFFSYGDAMLIDRTDGDSANG